jgi:DNA-binding transcriptional LysR family regulator
MNSNDWIILKTIAEELSITKAAERLFISQPSLTYRLNKLEKEFNAKILFRHSNGVIFTPQGEHLLKYSKDMITQLNQIKQDLVDMEDAFEGTLRLGVSTTFAKYNMAPIIKAFKDRYPNANIEFFTGASTMGLSEKKIGEDIDIIIRRGDSEWPGKKHILTEEPYGIITNHSFEFSELASMSWILDDSATITKSESEFLKWWDEAVKLQRPSKIIRVNSIETCIQLSSHGLGWTVVPKIHTTGKRNLCFTPIIWPNGDMMTQKTVMLYKEELLKFKLAETFINFILDEFSSKQYNIDHI